MQALDKPSQISRAFFIRQTDKLGFLCIFALFSYNKKIQIHCK